MEQLLQQTDNPYKNWVVDGENRVTFFNTGNIGGTLLFLDKAMLDDLASHILSSASTELTEEVDLRGTIELTARNGFFVDLAYKKQQQLQGVIILKDAYAEEWNPVAMELAKGLAHRDVPTMYGEFWNSLDNIQLIDNSDTLTSNTNIFLYAKETHLTNLVQYKENYVLLVFSNGQYLNLTHEQDNFNVLSAWPKVAWLELREPRNWDSGTKLPLSYGISVYPSNLDSLDKILSQFFIKQQPLDTYKLNPNHRRVLSYAGKQIDEKGNVDENFICYLENFLGDSLSWARACAMFQPLSLGLADKLRRKFFSELLPQRLERLLNLPSTSNTTGGLIFSNPVRSILREQFLKYFGKQRQQAILNFILQEMENPKVKPLEKVNGRYTLAYLNWKATYELVRVNIESEQESAKKELQLLLDTPLGNFIKRETRFVS